MTADSPLPLPSLEEITKQFTACPDCALMPEELTAESVAEVVAFEGHPGDYSEQDDHALLRLKDGRWAYWRIWADTTGHGCQCGQSAELFDNEAKARECWSLHATVQP